MPIPVSFALKPARAAAQWRVGGTAGEGGWVYVRGGAFEAEENGEEGCDHGQAGLHQRPHLRRVGVGDPLHAEDEEQVGEPHADADGEDARQLAALWQPAVNHLLRAQLLSRGTGCTRRGGTRRGGHRGGRAQGEAGHRLPHQRENYWVDRVALHIAADQNGAGAEDDLRQHLP